MVELYDGFILIRAVPLYEDDQEKLVALRIVSMEHVL
jgi:hypothetical protein